MKQQREPPECGRHPLTSTQTIQSSGRSSVGLTLGNPGHASPSLGLARSTLPIVPARICSLHLLQLPALEFGPAVSLIRWLSEFAPDFALLNSWLKNDGLANNIVTDFSQR
jgi:hypothetical protein